MNILNFQIELIINNLIKNMGFLNGDFTPHPNSLMFNAFPCFWPFKAYWFFRKVSTLLL